jgi:two-component system OmpR family response regulator
LIARLGNMMRRSVALSEFAGRLSFADLELDEDVMEVTGDGHVIELTGTEHRLLRFFLLNLRQVLSRPWMLDHVWSYDFEGCAGARGEGPGPRRAARQGRQPRAVARRRAGGRERIGGNDQQRQRPYVVCERRFGKWRQTWREREGSGSAQRLRSDV